MTATPWMQLMVSLDKLQFSETEATVRIPVAMVGTFFKGSQKCIISRADVAQMAENFAKRGNGEVVIDYEHASDNPEVALGGPVPAAGWIKGLDAKPDANGVVWGDAEFVDRARQMLSAGEYKYGSPVINWGTRDKGTGEQQGATLTSFALTNTPVLDRMPAIRLSDAAMDEGEKVGKQTAVCSEHPNAQVLCSECNADQFKKMAASENARAITVVRLSEVKRDTKGLIDLGSLGNDAVVSIDVVRAMDSERVALSEVDAAVTAGKITPAQREQFVKVALSDIDNFRGIVKTMQQVDLSERGHGGSGADADLGTLDKVDAEIKRLTTERAKKDGIPYHAALKLVASENPKLDSQRTRLARKAAGRGDE